MTTSASSMLQHANHTPALSLASQRFETLCAAAGFDAAAQRSARDVFQSLVLPELDVTNADIDWESGVSDEGFPLEFSVAISQGECEVRILFEPRAQAPTLSAHRQATLRFHERLSQRAGVDLSRFKQLEDLFLPENMEGQFAAWSSIVFRADGSQGFKAYLNPQAQGASRAYALTDVALRRLGFEHTWHALASCAARRGPYLDELKYFALDLNTGADARVKVYIRHHGATADELEAACSASREYVPGQALDFVKGMCGNTTRLFKRPGFTCTAFTSEERQTPLSTTLYVPVCAYAKHDAEVRDRISSYLDRSDAEAYATLIDTYATRPLKSGVGLQSWAALRKLHGTTRLTLYLSAELLHVYPPGSIPAPPRDRWNYDSPEVSVQNVLDYPLTAHPFLERLQQEPDISGHLWLLVTNVYEGTSKHFVKWLATVTANVDDERVRSLLARQLDQELGEGDISRAHSNLMRDFLEAIEGLRPAAFRDEQLRIGRRLGEQLARHYMSPDAHEGLAALMAGEICAEQLIRTVGVLLRAQPHALDASKLDWLFAHDELEASHAEESLVLARMLRSSHETMSSVQRGAWGVQHALWTALDGLYAMCFGSTFS